MSSSLAPSSRISESAGVHVGRPIFLPGWIKGLSHLNRWLLGSYCAFYAVGTLMLYVILKNDRYFYHDLKLVGLRIDDHLNQPVRYRAQFTMGMGFWPGSAKEIRRKDAISYNSTIITNIVNSHLAVGKELWTYCLTQSHRVSACFKASFYILTLALTGLFSGLFIFIFNRKWFLIISFFSIVLIVAAYTVLYAAALECNNCIIDRQLQRINEHEWRLVSYKGRYFRSQLVILKKRFIGIALSYACGFIPMTVIGVVIFHNGVEYL
ncbi:unnamed protein product [Calicophoron daubneyi]|uniref:Uncharacterized protein n=2 Tax=Calicophoron daubneyi TaxID=300641 RepID=A0AAV2T6E0_CALDB